ncbi:hypothetical protein DFP72DRAFT_1074469 [Ephemerocybe angulata]|uniref:Uncharacterized protein n=1 Tax=Ephemerocybe angulata TaxID=980116 RepID=A0A8H6HM31_9AGAR|nr:hypothetical protein DFP72DRAFT_1074469 [Tulosesus angulatus]
MDESTKAAPAQSGQQTAAERIQESPAGPSRGAPRQTTSFSLPLEQPRPSNRRDTSRTVLSYDPYAEVTAVPPSPSELQPNRRNTVQAINIERNDSSSTQVHAKGDSGKVAKVPSRARLVWWLATCAVFVILAPVIAILMGVTLHAREMSYSGAGGIEQFAGRTIDFEVVLISADPKAGMMRNGLADSQRS